MNINNPAIKLAKDLLGMNHSFENDLLLSLGSIAENDALLLTHNEKVLTDQYLLAQMIQFIYQRLGNETISSFSAASVSESYIEGYPRNLLIALQSYRKLKTL